MPPIATSIWSARDTAYIASAAKVASFSGLAIGVDRYSAIKVAILITAVSGTSPTLNVYLQTLLGDDVTWSDIASLTQLTATGNRVLDFINGGNSEYASVDGSLAAGTIRNALLGRWVRLKFVIAGTNPSFTLSANVILLQ